MKLFKFLFMVLTALSLAPQTALAGPEITRQVQKQYQAIASFAADFNQELYNAQSKEREKRSGKILFLQPGLIRWETVKPEKELLLVGQDAVWDYFEDEKSAYKYPVEEIVNSKTMLKFLSGKANLSEDFIVAEEKDQAAKDQGLTHLRLTPREAEPGLVMAQAYVDTKTFLLRRVILQDFYGNTNDLSLADIKVNISLPKTAFEFTPPKGVEIFDETKPRRQSSGR